MRSRGLPEKADGCGVKAALGGRERRSVAPRPFERISVAVLARHLGAQRFRVRKSVCVQ